METRPELSIAQGRYELLSALGEGGMAYVFRCTDTRLKVDRAVKFLAPRLMRHSQIRERFESEASTMALLNHPNIVQIFDIGNEKSLVYMVMELLEGGSVQDRIEKHGVLEPIQAIDVAIAMARGLGFAHRNNVIHRDIKLDNVLISRDGTPKVADFGIARVNDGRSGMTMTGAVMGTLAYMAPEQRLSARRAGPQADLYAVAASLYVMLSGENPSELFNEEIQREAFRDLSESVQQFLTKGCNYSPEDRFADAEGMISALEQLKDSVPPLSEGHKPLWTEASELIHNNIDRDRTETLNTMWTLLISEDSSGSFHKETQTEATLDGIFPDFDEINPDLHTMETLVPETTHQSPSDSETKHSEQSYSPDEKNTGRKEKDSKRTTLWLISAAALLALGFFLASNGPPPIDNETQTAQSDSPKNQNNQNNQNKPPKAAPLSLSDGQDSSNAKANRSTERSNTTKEKPPTIKAKPKNATVTNTKKQRSKTQSASAYGPEAAFVLSVIPARAKITISGKSSERFIKGKLPAGRHSVVYELDGTKTTQQVTIKKDGTTKLCYDFNKDGPCSRDF